MGPDGSSVAADPSACLTRDKAGEGRSAKWTAEKTRKADADLWLVLASEAI